MRFSSRDGWVLTAFCALIPVAACSRLVSVDWGQIKDNEPGGGSAPSPSAGEGGETGGGGVEQAGQGGALEAGAGGEGGSDVAGNAGGSGMAGNAGGSAGGNGGGGMGGTSGGATGGLGGSAGGGTGGTAGSGGSGIVIVGGAAAIAESIVLYDGGADAPNLAFGGRVGLNTRCAGKKAGLPHAKTVAFISVDAMDDIFRLPTTAGVPAAKRIISRTGVLLADDWLGLVGDSGAQGPAIKATLLEAGVVPAGAPRWLTGTAKNATFDENGACDGWTRADYSDLVQARFGRVDVVDVRWIFSHRASCDTSGHHVLCLAYD